jgi:hypothetical protein
MTIGKERYTKDLYPNIDDDLIGKTIPILYGTVGVIELDCINANQEDFTGGRYALYKLPIGTSLVDINPINRKIFIEVEDSWQVFAFEDYLVDYEAGTLRCLQGRNLNDSTRRIKVLSPVGFIFSGHSYPADIIAHIFEYFGGVKKTSSNYDVTEFDTELATIQNDIGFYINEKKDLWEFVYEIASKSRKFFRCYYNGAGKITARIRDFDRLSSGLIASCEIMNSGTIPIESNRQGVYASVLTKYFRNYFSECYLSVENTTYFDEVNRVYATDAQYEDITFLVNQADAESRAYELATMFADVPVTSRLRVAGNLDLKIFDVVTIALSPDNLDASAREYIGNKDCMVISVRPDRSVGVNEITVLILPNRTPIESQSAVRDSAYNTIEREQSSTEILIEEIEATIATSGIVQMTSTTAPAGTVIGQTGKYLDDFYLWDGSAWYKQESIYPVTPPIIRYDMDSLKLVGGNYLSPLIDNSGNMNHSESITGVTPV